MGSDEEGGAAEEERLLEVTNILMGACLLGVAEQLNGEIDFSCHLVMLLSEYSIEQLRTGLLQFMESF